MKPGDRLICAFTKALPADSQFIDWPLHVTVVPWFRLALNSELITANLERLLGTTAFIVQMGEENVQFGHQKDKRATLVQLPSPFTQLEQLVRGYFHDQHAWLVDESTSQRQEFRPHMTVQRTNGLHAGDTFQCDQLYIVEQKGPHKEVTGEIRLG